MTPLIPTPDLVRRCQKIIGECVASRVQTIIDRPGNPTGARVVRFGDAVACLAPPFGENLFNRGYGFTDATLEAAGEVADLYAAANVPGSFEIAPGLPSTELMALLTTRGYRQTAFHGAFAGATPLEDKPSPGIEVRRVTSEDDLAAFSDAYHTGWNASARRIPMTPWLKVESWRLYLGLCDGQPAGAAILCLRDGDAYLADSAVDPAFRRRGVHRAMLDRRCADAAAAGAAVVFSGADYLGDSSRNMVRKGLAVLYTKAVWIRQIGG